MASAAPSATDFDAARRAMIDSQLRTSGVNEPWVLARFASVPREDFVPPSARTVAYTDRAVPLDGDGMLPAPVVHGLMLSEAGPRMTDRALIVDGGSGYLPALLEGLVGSIAVITPAEALQGGEAGEAMDALRRFMFESVYLGETARQEHERIESVLRGLLTHFSTHVEQLPPAWPCQHTTTQRIVDWVAGMTDGYAVRSFVGLTVPRAFDA